MKNSLYTHSKASTAAEKICASVLLLAINLSVIGIGALSAEVTYAAEPTSTTVVSPTNMNSFEFMNEVPNGGGTFVPGPMFQPLGSGSLQLNVDKTGRHLFRTGLYGNTKLADINTLSYSSHTDFTSPDFVTTSLGFDLDANVTDAVSTLEGQLMYDPRLSHVVTKSVWQNWDTMDNSVGGDWYLNGMTGSTTNPCPLTNPCTWSEVLTAYPNGGIRDGGKLQFSVGGPSATLVTVYADNLVVGVLTNVVAFDFEPSPETTSEMLCGDNVDNDNDGVTDLFDEDCASARPMIRVVKELINDNGGTSTLANFSYQWRVATNEEDFVMPEGAVDLIFPFVGEYAITENPAVGYVTSYSANCTGTTTAGQASSTCTITNNDMGTSTTPTTPVDMCPNLSGNQTTMPAGTVIVEGQCVPAPIVVTPPAPPAPAPSTGVSSNGTGSASFDYWGCTNPNAVNYNRLANKEDGSCVSSASVLRAEGNTTSTTSGNTTSSDSSTSTSSTTNTTTSTTSSAVNIPPTASVGGEVLGAGTTTDEFSLPLSRTCAENPYMKGYLNMGKTNDSVSVRALQVFLNEEMNANLPLSGYFGSMTKNWVKKFQKKYEGEILKPWKDAGYTGDLSEGTGHVYKTTKRFINQLRCSDAVIIPMPDLSDDLKSTN